MLKAKLSRRQWYQQEGKERKDKIVYCGDICSTHNMHIYGNIKTVSKKRGEGGTFSKNKVQIHLGKIYFIDSVLKLAFNDAEDST